MSPRVTYVMNGRHLLRQDVVTSCSRILAAEGAQSCRATADRHLKSVIKRAEAYNADENRIYEIVQIVVFGSYLDRTLTELGDLDLAIVTRERTETGSTSTDLAKRALAYADESGRQFSTFFDKLNWAERELVQILRNRVAVISISLDDVSTFTNRWEVVYTVDR